jgi:hypothetical protein
MNSRHGASVVEEDHSQLNAALQGTESLVLKYSHANPWSSVAADLLGVQTSTLEVGFSDLTLTPIPEVTYFSQEMQWIEQLVRFLYHFVDLNFGLRLGTVAHDDYHDETNSSKPPWEFPK